MANPTIVLVPGSFTGQGVYQDIVDRFRAAGFPSLAIDLPSTRKSLGLEPASMYEDAKHIRAVAEALIERGKELVVVCHSYGGVPATEGLAGLPLKRLIYMTAVAPRVGESHLDAFEGGLVKVLVESAVKGYIHTDAPSLAAGIGNDFDSWEYAYECALRLPHHSARSFTDAVTRIAYENVPVSYILTEKDLILPPSLQEKFVRVLEEGKGQQINVIRKDWGHCPNWSQPDHLVRLLLEEARK